MNKKINQLCSSCFCALSKCRMVLISLITVCIIQHDELVTSSLHVHAPLLSQHDECTAICLPNAGGDLLDAQ
jgi:hypothetical protein